MASDTQRPAAAEHKRRKTAAERKAAEEQRKAEALYGRIKAWATPIAELRPAVAITPPPATSTTGYAAFTPPEPELAPELPSGPLPRPWFTLADAYKPRPPLRYCVDGLLPEGSLSVVYGAPGTLKTMLLLDLLVSVAMGDSWLPPLPNTDGEPIKTERSPVLIVDFDSGRRTILERLEAIGRGHGITSPEDCPIYAESMALPWLAAAERESVNGYVESIKARGVRLVAIDNLGQISLGLDENTAAMNAVMGNLRWLADETGAAVVLIHHERKGGLGDKTRPGEGMRGHSSVLAALDAAILVESEPGSGVVSVRSTKARSVPFMPFSARFTYTHKPGTRELETARFFGLGEDSEHLSNARITRAILAASSGPIAQGALVAAVRKELPEAGINRIRALVSEAVTNGHLAVTGGVKGARIYQAR